MQALRDAMSQLQAHNAVVFGISGDTVQAQKAFADKAKLNFPILADPDKKTIEAYGVLAPNGFARRVTFIVGPEGKIAGIDRSVDAEFLRDSTGLVSRHGLDLALALTDWKAKVGSPVPNFSLTSVDGKPAPLMVPRKKAAVVMFISKNCPVSQAYDGRMKALASDSAYQDVAFLGVNANSDETAAEVKAHAEKNGFPFPVAKDPHNALADHFNAQATPTVWVINSKGIAVYAGAIDDSQDAGGVKKTYLKDALDAALADKPVATPETRAFGCAIKREKRKG